MPQPLPCSSLDPTPTPVPSITLGPRHDQEVQPIPHATKEVTPPDLGREGFLRFFLPKLASVGCWLAAAKWRIFKKIYDIYYIYSNYASPPKNRLLLNDLDYQSTKVPKLHKPHGLT